MLNQLLQKVAILGAAGKMGSGISLLILLEMGQLAIRHPQNSYHLSLIDVSAERLCELKKYLKKQILKNAEKNINLLRDLFEDHKDLISNEQIIQAYLEKTFDLVSFDDQLSKASQAWLIFEAAIEDQHLKVELLKNIYQNSAIKPLILTNTSSLPIQELDQMAHLDHHLIGFHFYNPPADQELVEIIIPEGVSKEYQELAFELAKLLKKTVVCSQDIAGFIGNGHFMREVAFAGKLVQELQNQMPLADAIVLINHITQVYLLRPMGIFQLVDYVGIDVVVKIETIMANSLQDSTIQCELIEKFYQEGILGGQNQDGSQKDGIFKYQKGEMMEIFDLTRHYYRPFEKIFDEFVPEISWKILQKSPEKQTLLQKHFRSLNQQKDLNSTIAKRFLENSNQIAQNLVQDQVAHSLQDVSVVLKNGFFHAYGPDENFI